MFLTHSHFNYIHEHFQNELPKEYDYISSFIQTRLLKLENQLALKISFLAYFIMAIR